MKMTLILALALSPAAAFAGESSQGAQDGSKKMVCIKELEIGSRVARKRICKTAEQWKQDRMEARQMLEKANTTQTNPTG